MDGTYGMFMLFMVFTFEPMLGAAVQLLATLTETSWDDFAFGVMSELVQCWLFMRFSGCFIDDDLPPHDGDYFVRQDPARALYRMPMNYLFSAMRN